MLVDLARRLERARTARCALGHRGKLALVASHRRHVPSRSRRMRSSTSGSLRESLRLRPEVLRRLGWHYLRVHSFELFSDPDARGRADRAPHRRDRVSTETAPIQIPVAV